MKKIILITSLLISMIGFSQQKTFKISAELRPRYEYRHGYKILFNNTQKPAQFISQRTRLNFDYTKSDLKLKLVLQNVRTWGDVSTLSPGDLNNGVHEAWAEYKFSDLVSFKMGRQEIVYDDHRIFGNVGWAQQGQSHDAFLIKFSPENHRIDFGFALNNNAQTLVKILYNNVAGYKTFQYAWYHGNFDKFRVSLLALNTGIEYINSSNDTLFDYMQTLGPRIVYKTKSFNVALAAYYQAGKKLGNKVNASYFGASLNYKLNNVKIGAGLEYLSGKDMDDTSTDIKSFVPIFGTNHKFNGWMDYFYVGNHINSVGLIDVHFPIQYKKDKITFKIIPHFFSSAAKIIDMNTMKDNNLGTEIDMMFGYKLSKNAAFSMGYSQMFASESLEFLRGGDRNVTQNWAWVMFTFKPNLFTKTFE